MADSLCENPTLKYIGRLDPKQKNLIFLTIFNGVFVEKTNIHILFHFWFDEESKYNYFKAKSAAPNALTDEQIELLINFVNRCENVAVARNRADDIKNLVEFLNTFHESNCHRHVDYICGYMHVINDIPIENVEKKIYNELEQLAKKEKEWEQICKLFGDKESLKLTDSTRKQQIADLHKNLEIVNMMKNINQFATWQPKNIHALVKAMCLYLHEQSNATNKIDELSKQIANKLIARNIISWMQNFNESIHEHKNTTCDKFIIMCQFFKELKSKIDSEIFDKIPETGLAPDQLLEFFVSSSSRYASHTTPIEIEEINRIKIAFNFYYRW